MAIVFDTLNDEQVYSESMSELYECAPRIAREIGDIFVKADATEEHDVAQHLLDRVIDYTSGVLAGADYSSNTELVSIVRRILLTLVWSGISIQQ